jgi:hypothetical protein
MSEYFHFRGSGRMHCPVLSPSLNADFGEILPWSLVHKSRHPFYRVFVLNRKIISESAESQFHFRYGPKQSADLGQNMISILWKDLPKKPPAVFSMSYLFKPSALVPVSTQDSSISVTHVQTFSLRIFRPRGGKHDATSDHSCMYSNKVFLNQA